LHLLTNEKVKHNNRSLFWWLHSYFRSKSIQSEWHYTQRWECRQL